MSSPLFSPTGEEQKVFTPRPPREPVLITTMLQLRQDHSGVTAISITKFASLHFHGAPLVLFPSPVLSLSPSPSLSPPVKQAGGRAGGGASERAEAFADIRESLA